MKSRSSAGRSASPLRAPRAGKRKSAPLLAPSEKKRSTHRRSGEIMEAAAKVFAERGYHGATTQDIADVLGIRQASLYYYFPSKEVALEVVCAKSAEGFLNTAQAIASGPGTPVERLSAMIRQHISPVLERLDYIKVFLTQRHFLPATSRKRVAKISNGIEQAFEGIVREGIRTGHFRADLDPHLTMLTILGAANGVPSWYRKEGYSIEKIAGELIRLILSGITPADGPKPNRPRD